MVRYAHRHVLLQQGYIYFQTHGFIRTRMIETRTLLLFFILQVVYCVSGEANFNPLQHSGPASPYFDAPSQEGIPTETPSGCRVDQAAYIVRHGSSVPPSISEAVDFNNYLFS